MFVFTRGISTSGERMLFVGGSCLHPSTNKSSATSTIGSKTAVSIRRVVGILFVDGSTEY